MLDEPCYHNAIQGDLAGCSQLQLDELSDNNAYPLPSYAMEEELLIDTPSRTVMGIFGLSVSDVLPCHIIEALTLTPVLNVLAHFSMSVLYMSFPSPAVFSSCLGWL